MAGAQLTVPIEPQRTGAAARSNLYRLFSVAFTHPERADPGACDPIPEPGALERAAGALPYALTFAVGAPLRAPARADLHMRYTALFESGRGALSLHESAFSAVPKMKLWEELIRFYDHFGLRYQGHTERLWPDHLVVELELLHYLTFLETGLPGDPAALVRGQRDFIDRHLRAWLPKLAARLTQTPDAEPFAVLAAMLLAFLDAERAHLQGLLARPFAP